MIRVGQFSESPVLALARALGLDTRFGVEWETSRVASSPAQFESLRSGELDIVVTSPDNILLYTSTDKNPLGQQLDVRTLRAIDRGLGLALYTSAGIQSPEDLRGATLGVDVMSSGFALLLLTMLGHLGVDPGDVQFESLGATPKRLKAIVDGEIQGSILNAESAVAAEAAGLTRWVTSADIHPNYLGTVLAQMSGPISQEVEAFLAMWEEASHSIESLPAGELMAHLSHAAAALGERRYAELLKSEQFGILRDASIHADQLRALADIRARAGAYTPDEAAIRRMMELADGEGANGHD